MERKNRKCLLVLVSSFSQWVKSYPKGNPYYQHWIHIKSQTFYINSDVGFFYKFKFNREYWILNYLIYVFCSCNQYFKISKFAKQDVSYVFI